MIINLQSHPNFCPISWNEMTIDPHGNILFCCHSTEYKISHISEVNSLNEVFASTEYKKIRFKFENNIIHTACIKCINRNIEGIKTLRTHRLENLDEFDTKNIRLERLEVNLSNLCNQQCIMCSSAYSSQWVRDDRRLSRWGRNPTDYFNIREEDLIKIIKVLPQLKELTIKGGEPTIDPNFEKLLENIKSDQVVRLVSNFQNPRPRVFEIIKKLTNLKLVVSIDGTGDVYNWVRGGDWFRLKSNLIKLGTAKPNYRLNVTMTLNYWTLPHLYQDLIEIEKLQLESNLNIGVNLRLVTHPRYSSAEAVNPIVVQDQKQLIKAAKWNIEINGLDHLDILKFKPELVEDCINWEREINKIRKFSIK